jgi:hypothetical protein
MHELASILTPARFLTIAGSMLVLLGVAGMTGTLARISSASFFHPPKWINAFHFAFGLMLLGIVFAGGPRLQIGIVLCGAILGTTLGTLGLLLGPAAARRFELPELADPSDHCAHLMVGLFAFWAWSSA